PRDPPLREEQRFLPDALWGAHNPEKAGVKSHGSLFILFRFWNEEGIHDSRNHAAVACTPDHLLGRYVIPAGAQNLAQPHPGIEPEQDHLPEPVIGVGV